MLPCVRRTLGPTKGALQRPNTFTSDALSGVRASKRQWLRLSSPCPGGWQPA